MADAIRRKTRDGGITCAAAHHIAGMLRRDPLEIGAAILSMGIRIRQCQLGLFGGSSRSGIPTGGKTVLDEIQATIEALAVQNRITCRDCWWIAQNLDISKPAVARCAEALNIKISTCQLSLF